MAAENPSTEDYVGGQSHSPGGIRSLVAEYYGLSKPSSSLNNTSANPSAIGSNVPQLLQSSPGSSIPLPVVPSSQTSVTSSLEPAIMTTSTGLAVKNVQETVEHLCRTQSLAQLMKEAAASADAARKAENQLQEVVHDNYKHLLTTVVGLRAMQDVGGNTLSCAEQVANSVSDLADRESAIWIDTSEPFKKLNLLFKKQEFAARLNELATLPLKIQAKLDEAKYVEALTIIIDSEVSSLEELKECREWGMKTSQIENYLLSLKLLAQNAQEGIFSDFRRSDSWAAASTVTTAPDGTRWTERVAAKIINATNDPILRSTAAFQEWPLRLVSVEKVAKHRAAFQALMRYKSAPPHKSDDKIGQLNNSELISSLVGGISECVLVELLQPVQKVCCVNSHIPPDFEALSFFTILEFRTIILSVKTALEIVDDSQGSNVPHLVKAIYEEIKSAYFSHLKEIWKAAWANLTKSTSLDLREVQNLFKRFDQPYAKGVATADTTTIASGSSQSTTASAIDAAQLKFKEEVFIFLSGLIARLFTTVQLGLPMRMLFQCACPDGDEIINSLSLADQFVSVLSRATQEVFNAVLEPPALGVPSKTSSHSCTTYAFQQLYILCITAIGVTFVLLLKTAQGDFDVNPSVRSADSSEEDPQFHISAQVATDLICDTVNFPSSAVRDYSLDCGLKIIYYYHGEFVAQVVDNSNSSRDGFIFGLLFVIDSFTNAIIPHVRGIAQGRGLAQYWNPSILMDHLQRQHEVLQSFLIETMAHRMCNSLSLACSYEMLEQLLSTQNDNELTLLPADIDKQIFQVLDLCYRNLIHTEEGRQSDNDNNNNNIDESTAREFVDFFMESVSDECRQGDKNPQYLKLEVGMRPLVEVMEKAKRCTGAWANRILINIHLTAWKLFCEEIVRSSPESTVVPVEERILQLHLTLCLYSMAKSIAYCFGSTLKRNNKAKDFMYHSLGVLFNIHAAILAKEHDGHPNNDLYWLEWTIQHKECLSDRTKNWLCYYSTNDAGA